MTTVSAFMGEDHDELDGIFESFTGRLEDDLEKAAALFQDFRVRLQKHIVWEEDILFPIFEEKTGMREGGPTAVMRMEHQQIKQYLAQIQQKLDAKQREGIDELKAGLVETLVAHNQKEENILYPAIDDVLNDQEREQVFTRMKEVPPEAYEG